jgi:hypothetical protein
MVTYRRKKEKSEPSRESNQGHYSTNASRKSGDALILLIARIHCTCSSKWIHKVAVYDIMAISWGAQTMGLIPTYRGRPGEGYYIQFVTYMASFTAQYSRHIHYITFLKLFRVPTWAETIMLVYDPFVSRLFTANAHVQSKINTFLHWRHAFTPKDFQMHQQSLDHSYCKRETSLTKLKNL